MNYLPDPFQEGELKVEEHCCVGAELWEGRRGPVPGEALETSPLLPLSRTNSAPYVGGLVISNCLTPKVVVHWVVHSDAFLSHGPG